MAMTFMVFLGRNTTISFVSRETQSSLHSVSEDKSVADERRQLGVAFSTVLYDVAFLVPNELSAAIRYCHFVVGIKWVC